MSFDWTSQPQSIQSIAAQYTLPVVIRSAPGFRGSSRPIILYSISRVTFALGRALKTSPTSTKNEDGSYRPIDSEIIAIPLKYPGYFECLPSKNFAKETNVVPEKSIQPIVERMEIDQRPQAFYIMSSMRVYTVEENNTGVLNRVWHQIDPHQIILFDKLVHVEYTPTESDDLTDDDYALSWWMCFGKQIIPRKEYALKCILTQQQFCYIPCSSTEEINLIPIGQRGSNNVKKLQMISNLTENFPMPINIKLAQLPGSYAYKDFNGYLQLLGPRSEELAICGSLLSSHTAAIPTNTPLKFVVAPLPATSPEIQKTLSCCHIFSHSFDMQIRRILISSRPEFTTRRARSRYPKIQAAIDDQLKRYKRSYSVEQQPTTKDEHVTTTTDEGYRSSSSAAKKRAQYRQSKSINVSIHDSQSSASNKRRESTDEDSNYNSLLHHFPARKASSPPPVPKKPPNFPYPSFNGGGSSNSLIDEIDSVDAEGAILMDANNELSLVLPSDSRFS